MLGRGKMDRNVIEMVEIGRLVPREHLFRKIDEAVDFNCLYKMVEPLCTHSKDYFKTVQRHIWKDYEELADDARYTPKYQELYRRRKETVERVFADAKEKHTMRYTQYRGLAQAANWVGLSLLP